MAEKIKLKRRAKGNRPYFFDDPNIDRVVSMIMGLAGEVSVMRDRLDTIERLLEANKALKRKDIDTYKPNAKVATERAAWREAFLSEVMRIVEAELEGLEDGSDEPYEKAIKRVVTDFKN